MIDDSRFFECVLESPVHYDPRCPIVLLLDASSGMSGSAISGLTAGLRTFKAALSRDAQTARRVEIAVVSFGDQIVRREFVPAGEFDPPALQSVGKSVAPSAIASAIELIAERTRDYKTSGVPSYRPWIFFVAGRLRDFDEPWGDVPQHVRKLEADKALTFVSVGLESADMPALAQISERPALKLRDLKFKDMFEWLAANLVRVAHSNVGDEVKVDSPLVWGNAQ